MYSIRYTPEFETWFRSLKDTVTRQRLSVRLRKASLGNLGDCKSLGAQVFEMREHFGSGWRLYCFQSGETVIVLLGGGDKSTQRQDIAKALALAKVLQSPVRTP